MNYLQRVVKKIRLWQKFYSIGDNYFEIVWYRIVNMLSLDKLVGYDATIRLKNGVQVHYGNPMDLSAVPVIVEIWFDQIYNPEHFAIRQHDTVVDLGANVGNFSLYAAKHTDGPIYAFEPVQKNYDLLLENITRNSARNIIPVLAAVSNQTGTMTMHVSAVDTAHSLTHEAFSQRGDVEVKTYDLETFCAERNITHIDFLKVDCEGAEYDIFLGMSDAEFARLDRIVIEHHERFVHRDHKEISRALEKHGFIVDEFPDHFISARRPATASQQSETQKDRQP